jgi:catechol 2,3-dioxygenase-like lactoylglutathione lyase family enzyme
MIEISRISHVTQVVPDVEKQVALLTGLFGFEVRERREAPAESANGATLAVPGRSGIDWRVMAPTADTSSYQAFLDSPRGPGVHHVAVEVEDVAATAKQLEEAGVSLAGQGERWVEARMNPADAEGLRYRFVAGERGDSGGEPAKGSGGTMLDIKGFDHICQAYANRDVLARWYETLLGYREIWRTPDGEHDDLADLVMEIPGKQMFWEIIQPVGEGSFIERFVASRGPAAHHVTFEVKDWEKAIAACEHHEVPTFDDNSGETDGARWQDTFIHPKHTGGMLVQLFWEEKPGVWVRSDKVPSGG